MSNNDYIMLIQQDVKKNLNKFYEIERDGTVIITRYGRIGSKGTRKEHPFPSDMEALNFFEKKRWEKMAKGYQEEKQDDEINKSHIEEALEALKVLESYPYHSFPRYLAKQSQSMQDAFQMYLNAIPRLVKAGRQLSVEDLFPNRSSIEAEKRRLNDILRYGQHVDNNDYNAAKDVLDELVESIVDDFIHSDKQFTVLDVLLEMESLRNIVPVGDAADTIEICWHNNEDFMNDYEKLIVWFDEKEYNLYIPYGTDPADYDLEDKSILETIYAN